MTDTFSSVHPVAALFPMLPEDELRDLADDIKTNGLQQPVVVSDGVLIDGRNRLAACEMAKVDPEFVEMNGADPVQFILSANLNRRHMSKGQRATAVAKAVPKEPSRKLASAHGVGHPTIQKARQVLNADSDLADQVLAGTISLNEAYGIISDRRKEVERLTAKREQLRTMAPDLDDQVSEEVLKLSEALAEAQQREEDHKGAVRRTQERLLSLVDGWVALTSLSTNPDRETLLEGLNQKDRQTVQEVEAMYQETQNG